MPSNGIYERACSGMLDAILHFPPPVAWQSAVEILCRACESPHGYIAWLSTGESKSACVSCYCDVNGFGELRSIGPLEGIGTWEQQLRSTPPRLTFCGLQDCPCEKSGYSLTVPLMHRDHFVGMLSVSRGHTYEEAEVGTVAGLSQVLGTALVAARTSWGQPPAAITGRFQEIRPDHDPCDEITRVSKQISEEVFEDLAGQSVTELHLRRQLADVHAILDSTDAVIYVKDLNGRYEFINRKFEQLFNVTRQSIVGLTDLEVFHNSPEMAARFQENDRLVARLGKSQQFEEQAPHEDGAHTYVSVKFPLHGPCGNVRATAGISTDITSRKISELRLAVEQRRTEQILASIADGVVRLDGDGVIRYLNSAARSMLAVPADFPVTGKSFHELFHHTSSDGDEVAWSDCPVHKVLQTGLDAIDQQTQFFKLDGWPFAVEFSAVAIFEEGTQNGAVVTFRDITARLERRKMRDELEAAKAVQRNLYPRSNPSVPGYDIAGAVYPANPVCGDYFDFIWRDPQHLAMVVTDACGHDLSAALMMVDARANLRSRLATSDPIDKILTDVNSILKADLQTGKFVTGFLAEIDLIDKRISYAGAGARAILMRADGDIVELVGDGLVLGIEESVGMQGVASIDFRPGDILLMTSDGLSETMSPRREMFGNRRIHELLRETRNLSSCETVACMYAQAQEFSGTSLPQDDIAMIIVKAL